jgi:hypothetical protein
MNELLVLKQKMLKVLVAEQEKRELVSDNSWILRELTAMLNAVNTERVRRRLSVITMEELQRRERLAQGHSDYSQKVALYCAELALGQPDQGP